MTRAHLSTRHCVRSCSVIPGRAVPFASVSLQGTSLRPEDDASAVIDGRAITARDIVYGTQETMPAAGRQVVEALQKKAPGNASAPSR